MDTITEFYEDRLDQSIDIDGTIDYSRGYVHHNLFLPYETLKQILLLDEKTRAIDEVLLNSSHVAIEHYLSRFLSLRKIREDVKVVQAEIRPREIPIKNVISIVDTEEQRDIDVSEISFDDKSIRLSSHAHDNNTCRLHYVAGFDSGEGQTEIAEAIVKTFLQKRHALYLEMNESQEMDSLGFLSYELSDEVKQLLSPYKRVE